jgi:hypothetical protein
LSGAALNADRARTSDLFVEKRKLIPKWLLVFDYLKISTSRPCSPVHAQNDVACAGEGRNGEAEVLTEVIIHPQGQGISLHRAIGLEAKTTERSHCSSGWRAVIA